MLRLLSVAVLSLTAVAATALEPRRVYAYVYDLDTDKYLYTEVHDQQFDPNRGAVTSTIHYVMPDGLEFGRKTIDFSQDSLVPVYRLEMTREGYVEGITDNAGAIAMLRQRPGSAPETESLPKEGLLAADAGLMRLLQANFDKLSAGETVNFRVIAPSRLSAYKFKAKRIDDTTFEGKPASRVQVDMDSMLKLFAGPLIFTFDRDRHLCEFRGPTNVRNPATGKDYAVRLAFYSRLPEGVTLPALPEARR